MEIQIIETKDGLKTFSLDNVFFHSKYSPLKEAERFVEAATLPYTPKLIFLIEPGFAYCNEFFKKKFNGCELAAIRLIDSNLFVSANKSDYEINYDKINNFTNYLVNTFGEEKLLGSAIFIWPAAQNIFNEKVQKILLEYKEALNQSKTLLVTRQFFEKKWLLNSCNFILHTKKTARVNTKISCPLVICASGPSLEPCLKSLEKNQNKVFIISLSSSLKALLDHKIIPDAVMTTDGGYWAGEHLKALKAYKEIPIICSSESYVPKKLLAQNPILTIEYDDSSSFISNEILKKACITGHKALRNPTVSGTALYFADNICDSQIYFLGLDLHEQPGLQHTKPNELEINNSLKDNRLKNSLTRNCTSMFNTQSLRIYEEWFSSLEYKKNIIRVMDLQFKKNSLGNINEISSSDFDKRIFVLDKTNKHFFVFNERSFTNTKAVFDYIIKQLESEKWQHQIFPADFISFSSDKERLNAKVCKLIEKIGKLKNAAE